MGTKICKECGRELPLDHFAKYHFGTSNTCKECAGKAISMGHKNKKTEENLYKQLEEAKKARLSEFTPRELMQELHTRGYEGTLRFTQVQEIDISNF